MSQNVNTAQTNKVLLDDKTEYYYTINPFELKNALGSTIAILQEYTFSKSSENTEQVNYKLYKTREGNWYEISDLKSAVDFSILRRLKTAMDNLKTEFQSQDR